MDTNNYEEAKHFFESNSRFGFNHILLFIVSPDFFIQYSLDKDIINGRVISIAYPHPVIAKLNFISNSLKGYKVMISQGFSCDFGVKYITKNKEITPEIKDLIAQDVTNHYRQLSLSKH